MRLLILLLFPVTVLAWHDELRWENQEQSAFDRKESIEYHKAWCDLTFADYIQFDDSARELERFSISKPLAAEYVVYTSTAETQHAALADRCFYPVE